MTEQPRCDEYVVDWKRSDAVGCCSGLGARADTINFSIRQVLVEIVKDRFERTLVAQVTLAKVPKEADLRWFPISCFRIHRILRDEATDLVT